MRRQPDIEIPFPPIFGKLRPEPSNSTSMVLGRWRVPSDDMVYCKTPTDKDALVVAMIPHLVIFYAPWRRRIPEQATIGYRGRWAASDESMPQFSCAPVMLCISQLPLPIGHLAMPRGSGWHVCQFRLKLARPETEHLISSQSGSWWRREHGTIRP